jgi:CRP-like cAMP-binding protein
MNTLIPVAADQLAALSQTSRAKTLGQSDRLRLRSADLLAMLDERTFSILADHAKLVCSGWDIALYERNDRVEGLYILLEGEVKLLGEGNALFEIVTPIQSFGEAVMLGNQASPFTAKACRGAQLAWLPKSAIEDAMASNSAFVMRILDRLAQGCQSQIQEIYELRCLNPGERLARYLAEKSDVAKPGGLRLPMSKKVLAHRLGMTPESLARAITRLCAHGVARGPEDSLLITDLGALRRFAKLPALAARPRAA